MYPSVKYLTLLCVNVSIHINLSLTFQDMCRYWPKDKETIKTGSYTISLDSMAKIGECLFSYSVTMQRDVSDLQGEKHHINRDDCFV